MGFGFRVWGCIGIMEKKIETTIRVSGLEIDWDNGKKWKLLLRVLTFGSRV